MSLIAGKSVTLNGSARVRGLSLIDGATLTIGANGSRLFRTTGLGITSGSRLDLKDNDFAFDYVGEKSALGYWSGDNYNGVTGFVASGCNGGSWNGNGIVTSMSTAADANTPTTLAVSEAWRAFGLNAYSTQTTLFDGQTIDGSTVIVKYTYGGDANLDGIISGDDYSAIDFYAIAPNSHDWWEGDFNYDGLVNGDDYSAIDFALLAQGAPL
jgi:hypothetical protein